MLKKIVAVPALVAAALFSGAAVANTTTPPATTAPDKATFKGADASKTRDWSQLDTNKDHSISPEEMRKWMEANTEWGKAATKRN
ncbi:MAG TPA: hypothetical protein PLX20_06600 [Rhodocyclaceae bacterium]|nr:hypothetical protein [Rhodocyclaceae bacterium]HMV52681.1 hypothetical protein [Rhodocyclaceae bacterium]HMZ83547.1 hypothetical protein [Rhodocyclaceae bacterium]HNA04600.1 hypothetical protein [Rhodocyclaceae bacterium]HNB78957.1 hypothetical protein [Rhodocyclaceae bacterium]